MDGFSLRFRRYIVSYQDDSMMAKRENLDRVKYKWQVEQALSLADTNNPPKIKKNAHKISAMAFEKISGV